MDELVSVIVPIYNGEKDIYNCVQSIQKQKYKTIEIILVNDGSTDETEMICKKMQEEDKRIKYFYKENSGVSETRNYGVEKANGEYITFVDCDDEVTEDYISIMYETLKKYNVDVVRCKAKRITQNNHILKENLYTLRNKKVSGEEKNKLIEHVIIPKESINAYCCLLLIKKDYIVKFDSNLKFMEDTEFFVRLLEKINSIYMLDKELYIYNYNEKSATKNIENIKKNIKEILKANYIIKMDLGLKENEQIFKIINNQSFNLIFSKLKLSHRANCFKIRRLVKETLKSEDVKNIISNLYIKELSIIKKIQYCFIKFRMYFALAITIKITSKKER